MTEEQQKLYDEHFNDLINVGDLISLQEEQITPRIDRLLKILPNNGKLYKYRSFEKESFEKNLAALRSGKIWMAKATTLNDDCDTTVQYSEQDVDFIKDYIYKNKILFCRWFMQQPNNKELFGGDMLYQLAFDRLLDCVDENGHLNEILAIDIFTKYYHSEEKATKILHNILREIDNFISRLDIQKLAQMHLGFNSDLREEEFVFSTSSNANNNVMWALYAMNNIGYCIEYDYNKIKEVSLKAKNELLKIYKINYVKEKTRFSFEPLINVVLGIKQNQQEVFKDLKNKKLEKEYDWRFENEWRICTTQFKEDTSQKKGYFIDADLVSRIIIDDRALQNEELKARQLIDLCHEKNWKLIIRYVSNINGSHYYKDANF